VRFDRYQRLARHRALMPVWAFLIALAVILPGLSSPGLWEPQEMRVADDAAERADRTVARAAEEGAKAKPATPPATECPKQASDDDGARNLTPELAAAGLSSLGSDEGDMRLLLALLGLLTVLAVYGTGARLASPRAGLAAAVVVLSFPMLVLQARQLTSEIGTAAGAALVVYGLVAAARPARWPGPCPTW
jgi:4-amino-4-deoxy-L-arabinose transferase-like glycosyltransferase